MHEWMFSEMRQRYRDASEVFPTPGQVVTPSHTFFFLFRFSLNLGLLGSRGRSTRTQRADRLHDLYPADCPRLLQSPQLSMQSRIGPGDKLKHPLNKECSDLHQKTVDKDIETCRADATRLFESQS